MNSPLTAALQASSGYHPHGVCYLWERDLVWTHVVSDGLIALAYYSIPVGLVYFVRKRRDVPFDGLFVAFATFILACGTTHVMAIWTLWNPDFWAAAWVKVATAGASLATAAFMVPMLPKAILLPSPSDLRAKNEELEAAHHRIGELNGRLEAKVRELEVANADLRTFAYSISHDLKAPLRAMEGFSNALVEDCTESLDERCRDFAHRIAGGSARMSRLIDDLLEYSRLTLKELPASRVELGALLRDLGASLQSTIDETGADVSIEAEPDDVRAHPGTLTMALSNLLSNALTYVDPSRPPRVEIRSRRVDGVVRIAVRDNGIGVAEADQERIFRIFERLHGVERYGGTGIGLAAVAKGVERLGGRVGVVSKVGEGSEFWIEVPRWEGDT